MDKCVPYVCVGPFSLSEGQTRSIRGAMSPWIGQGLCCPRMVQSMAVNDVIPYVREALDRPRAMLPEVYAVHACLIGLSVPRSMLEQYALQ